MTSSSSSENNTPKDWLRLQTFGDPQLERLEAAVKRWSERRFYNDKPCWLTLCGNSGVGKTHCARAIWNANNRAIQRDSMTCNYSPQFVWWPELVNELRAGKSFDKVADIKRWPLLVLDEIVASRDTTGFVADQLYFVLAQRECKWTVITTNLTFEQIAQMDGRLASRCIRNNGIVVEVNTKDFASR